jgi:hypothetical protein
MFALKYFVGDCFGVALLAVMGCGGTTSNCGVTGLNIAPPTATVNHAVAAPGNSETFSSTFRFTNNPGCPAITAALVNSNWTASDSSVQLSPSPTSVVTATCTVAITGPITITATSADGQMLTGQASLTCN